jgi:hypothetical protein
MPDLPARYEAWVEAYATKVCPEGCMPTPGQEREISLFAEVYRSLINPRQEIAIRDASIALLQDVIKNLQNTTQNLESQLQLVVAESILPRNAIIEQCVQAALGPDREFTHSQEWEDGYTEGRVCAAEDIRALKSKPPGE